MDSGKAVLALSMLLLATSNVNAQSFSIEQNGCDGNELAFFSLADKQGGNIGQPGYFDYDLCGSGVEDVEITESCPDDLTSMVSMYQENDSHVSIYDSFRLNVCTSFPAAINNSCQSDERIISMGKKDDAHVGAPGELQYQLCTQPREVDTVSLEMKFNANQVYVDGEQAQEKTYSADELSYPYIVSDDPAGIVNYGDFVSLSYSTEDSEDVFRVTQNDEGYFLLPNTKGGYTEIEDEQQEVEKQELLEKFAPSFSFPARNKPLVKVIYDPSVDIHGFDRELRNNFELYSRHMVDDDDNADVEIGPT